MPFSIVQNDITAMTAVAIVNAANSELLPGGGVCGAIFKKAGYEALNAACRTIGHCPTGGAVLTPGFRLNARYVIHAVGPVWQGGGQGEEALLYRCYRSALALAAEHGCASVAFPLISAGIYGYPRSEALSVATRAIRDFLAMQQEEPEVYLVLPERTGLTSDERCDRRLRRYLREHGETRSPVRNRPAWLRKADPTGRSSLRPGALGNKSPSRQEEPELLACLQLLEEETEAERGTVPVQAERSVTANPTGRRLSDVVQQLEEPFCRMLFRLIDQRGMTDVEVYKRANLDRKLFSKLRRPDYHPGKGTVLALAVALRLNLDETKDLLARAGYALSPCRLSDVIVEFYITEGIYDIDEVNLALFRYGQKLLGA